MSGELTKLKMQAYADEAYNSPVDDGEFTTLSNPENYTFHYRIESNEEQAPGTSGTPPRFNKILPENLELEFVFDRTGAIKGYESTGQDGIIDDIERFKRIVFNYNGDEHQPNYLKIFWGTLLFKGKLTEMDITFKLFKGDGTPLRAVAKAKFVGHVEDDLRVARENAQSPDLTHTRVVKDGDTLPLMSFRIYGDSKYYLQVAKVNGIDNFRKLRTGQEIFFPPIEKQKI